MIIFKPKWINIQPNLSTLTLKGRDTVLARFLLKFGSFKLSITFLRKNLNMVQNISNFQKNSLKLMDFGRFVI